MDGVVVEESGDTKNRSRFHCMCVDEGMSKPSQERGNVARCFFKSPAVVAIKSLDSASGMGVSASASACDADLPSADACGRPPSVAASAATSWLCCGN